MLLRPPQLDAGGADGLYFDGRWSWTKVPRRELTPPQGRFRHDALADRADVALIRRHRRSTTIFVIFLVLAAGCGSGTDDASDTPISAPTTSNSTVAAPTVPPLTATDCAVVLDGLPPWVSAISDPAELWRVVDDHMSTVLSHTSGRVDRWDIVNEPLETIRSEIHQSLFQRVLGPDYMLQVLQRAHEIDPDISLWINENAVEYLPAKANALVALARSLLESGAWLDRTPVIFTADAGN